MDKIVGTPSSRHEIGRLRHFRPQIVCQSLQYAWSFHSVFTLFESVRKFSFGCKQIYTFRGLDAGEASALQDWLCFRSRSIPENAHIKGNAHMKGSNARPKNNVW